MVAVKMRITIKSEAKPQFSESVQSPLPNHTFTEAVNQSIYGHVLVSFVVKIDTASLSCETKTCREKTKHVTCSHPLRECQKLGSDTSMRPTNAIHHPHPQAQLSSFPDCMRRGVRSQGSNVWMYLGRTRKPGKEAEEPVPGLVPPSITQQMLRNLGEGAVLSFWVEWRRQAQVIHRLESPSVYSSS